MIITENRIKVTDDMMMYAGMTRMTSSGMQIGVPRTVGNSKSLSWRDLIELTDDDFDKIEEYFLSKTSSDAK